MDRKFFLSGGRSCFRIYVLYRSRVQLTLDVRVTRGVLGRTIALGVLVVDGLAEGVFAAHDALARVRPLLGLLAHAPFAGVARASRGAQALEPAGDVLAPAVLSARVRSALVRGGRGSWNRKRIVRMLLRSLRKP